MLRNRSKVIDRIDQLHRHLDELESKLQARPETVFIPTYDGAVIEQFLNYLTDRKTLSRETITELRKAYPSFIHQKELEKKARYLKYDMSESH